MSVVNAVPLLEAAGGDYQISRSVRLRSSATAYFNRTPASATNRQIMTFSMWVKLGSIIGGSGYLFSANTASGFNDAFGISFASGTLDLSATSGGATVADLNSTQVFRDPSAWYHIFYAIDTTQATASNRIKLYINGAQVTAFGTATYPAQNTSLQMNNTVPTYIGRLGYTSSALFDGYLTEINFIDGQALTPSSFGSTNSVTGVWQPIKYTGTYGTNGFYLNFSDNSAATAAAIGKDYSGNGNNWTPNNISVTAGVTYDSMLDVPTPYADGGNGRGNYAVANPIFPLSQTQTYSNANLQVSGTYGLSIATIAVSSGKFYCEAVYSALAASGLVGVQSFNQINAGGTPVRSTGSVGYWSYGSKIVDNVDSAYGATWTTNDVIGIAVDFDNNQITFYKNNVSQGTISYTFSNYSNWTFGSGSGGTVGTNTLVWNFGQRPFTYTPPAGFKALNTQNLPDATITSGNKHFNTVLWTGNGASSRSFTGWGFAPNFIWMKNRVAATDHALIDSVRGTGAKVLESNLTDAENSYGLSVTSFDSDGFTGATGSLNFSYANNNTQTYVGWGWKAGGAAVSNTAGSITSQVSANPTAGISVVTYTGTGANATVGHGLGVAPKMVIVKLRSGVQDWIVWQTALAGTDYLILDSTAAKASQPTFWNSTVPSSSVFSLGTGGATNTISGTYVAYCWSEVAGYSKFGSYTGNGSTDGPFVYCGFRPRFVMLKRTDTTGSWIMWDTARNTYNQAQNYLLANASNAEANNGGGAGSWNEDILSNGFKIRSDSSAAQINASGGTYIFMAFAENPFKNSLAR